MATYATQADFEDYSIGWVTTDPQALEKVLKAAERDLDQRVFATVPRTADQPLKFAPAELDLNDREALTRATCAQAEYRFEMGEAFFRKHQHESVSGPQFSTSGRLPYIGPKVKAELAGTALASSASGWSTVGFVPVGHRAVSSRRIR